MHKQNKTKYGYFGQLQTHNYRIVGLQFWTYFYIQKVKMFEFDTVGRKFSEKVEA